MAGNNASWWDDALDVAKNVASATPIGMAYRALGIDPVQQIKNAPHSAANFEKGIINAVRHPLNTLNGIANVGAGGIENAATAVLPSGVMRRLDSLSDPAELARERAAASSFAQGLKHRYGGVDAAQNTLNTDPVGAAADLSMALAGGEGALSRIAPEAAESLGTASKLSNPLAAANKATGYIPGVKRLNNTLSKPFSKPVPVLDDQGNMTPDAHTAIQQSGLDPSLFDDGLTNTWHDLSKTKGASAASAREALLRHVGVDDVNRGTTVGEKPSSAAPDVKNPVDGLLTNARQAVADHLGAQAPDISDTALGNAFIKNALERKQAIASNYGDASQHSGAFTPESVNDFQDIVSQGLQDPNNIGLPATLKGVYESNRMPVTTAILKGTGDLPGILKRMSDMGENTSNLGDLDGLPNRTNAPEALTLDGIENLRRDINQADTGNLSSGDKSGLHVLRNAIDTWTQSHIENGDFSGDGEAALSDLQGARQAHGDFARTYSGNSNPVVKNLWNKISPFVNNADATTTAADIPEADAQAVGQILANNVTKPGTLDPIAPKNNTPSGLQTYNAVTQPSPNGGFAPLDAAGVDALHDTLKARLMGSLNTALATKKPAALRDAGTGLTNAPDSPLADAVLDGDDRTSIAQHAAANDLLDQAQKTKTPSSLDAGQSIPQAAVNRLGRFGLTSGIGALTGAAAHLSGAVPAALAEAAGAGVGGHLGNAVTNAIEDRSSAKRNAAEMSGAPVALQTPSSAISDRLNSGALVASKSVPPEQPQPDNKPVQAPGFTGKAVTLDQAFAAPEPTGNPGTEPSDKPDDKGQFSGKPVSIDDAFAQPNPDGHASGGRAGYKSGGSVDKDIEPLVRRLMTKAEKARKDSVKRTEPLLNHDDASIIAALNVAKRKI